LNLVKKKLEYNFIANETVTSFSVPNEGYSRNESCALNLISSSLFTAFNIYTEYVKNICNFR